MTAKITKVLAREVLDSRGLPTVQADVILDNGLIGRATAPAGASMGRREASELRDGDGKRYLGKGVLQAVRGVRNEIAPALVGRDPTQQSKIDRLLLDLDGTANKGRLGANAIVAVSMAVARAGALASGIPLYRYLGGKKANLLPVPQVNVINGGRHAENSLDMQEFMIVPRGAPSFSEALRMASETFQHLKRILKRKGHSVGLGDEGGFAPDLRSGEEAMAVIVEAIEQAGYRPGDDIALALDPAASEFHKNGGYEFKKSGGGKKTSHEMVSLYSAWVDEFPLVSIEDGLAEDDWSGWKTLTGAIGAEVQLVGDDIFVTDPGLIRRGIDEKVANAVLIKVNQIGTVSETLKAVETAREGGYAVVISHRSGETEDTFIADLAVAVEAGQIKTGSLCRSERIAKYNRLLEIEEDLGANARFLDPFAKTSGP
ncbi:MAG TPA: phosphopyruvate hydratase [candidate division Zixibacteria bacterium]|nr:phosphopyruvate hydratase [candidate division Zixibacteria bacterium]